MDMTGYSNRSSQHGGGFHVTGQDAMFMGGQQSQGLTADEAAYWRPNWGRAQAEQWLATQPEMVGILRPTSDGWYAISYRKGAKVFHTQVVVEADKYVVRDAAGNMQKFNDLDGVFMFLKVVKFAGDPYQSDPYAMQQAGHGMQQGSGGGHSGGGGGYSQQSSGGGGGERHSARRRRTHSRLKLDRRESNAHRSGGGAGSSTSGGGGHVGGENLMELRQDILADLEEVQVLLAGAINPKKKKDERLDKVKEAKSLLKKVAVRHPGRLGNKRRPVSELWANDGPRGEWSMENNKFKKMEAAALDRLFMLSKGDEDDDEEDSDDDGRRRGGASSSVPRVKLCPRLSSIIVYSFYFFWCFLIFGMFLVKSFLNIPENQQAVPVGEEKTPSRFASLQGDVRRDGLFPDDFGFGGGLGITMLPVPPQYNLKDSAGQRVIVPLIYGIMHCAMFSLGMIPLTLIRGIWRDVVRMWPGVKRFIPIDDAIRLHIRLGTACLLCICIGAFLWMGQIGKNCLDGVPRACLSFDPPLKNFSDPIANVVVLRFTVWSTWMFVLPLMFIARTGPPLFFGRIRFVRLWWWEFCLYAHMIVVYVGLVYALAARFQVFYPVLFSWSVYFFDVFREVVFHQKKVDIAEADTFSRADKGATSFHLKLKPRGKFRVVAGQWLYLQVPCVDYTFHPFSIASASGDECVELHIGIIGGRGSGTWTAKMFEKINDARAYRNEGASVSDMFNFTARVRGPYGAAFVSCFDPVNAGAVVIGAGTGLTAAESVMREIIQRKANGDRVPARIWFVWSCSSADDLLWVWKRLVDVVIFACDKGILDTTNVFMRSSMLDWLGVTVYVSRASDKDLENFRNINSVNSSKSPDAAPPSSSSAGGEKSEKELAYERAEAEARRNKVQSWLLHRIVIGGLDRKETHIEKFLTGVRNMLFEIREKKKNFSVCFCGPVGLAHTIEQSARRITMNDGSAKVEFSADHQ